MKKAYFNWSGGKDSTLALYKILQQEEFVISQLLTTISQEYQRISMHGVRLELLKKQAESIGIPLKVLEVPSSTSMESYNKIIGKQNLAFKSQGFHHTIFGDIFLEELRTYREKQLAEAEIKAIFPLWQQDTKATVLEFINLGFQAITVAVDAQKLDESFVGRRIDLDFLNDLPKDIDPCGENGEFHSFVFDGPIFTQPIDFQIGEKVLRTYEGEEKAWSNAFWYCDLI